MSKIKVLPEVLSNKIAAGEVVARPASVVKELIENSLDAGSSRIIIEVEQGGRSLIRVADNGAGMDHDDALLCLERYATSKIYRDRDLFCINTLGFRGEALPSIAAVARFSLVTRDAISEAGTEISVDGGKIRKVAAVGAPAGTMVSVRQLFFNTPARRKFLKSVGTEMGHIAEIVASTAMGRSDVQFKLIHNHKTVKDWPATDAAFDRVVDVIGRELQQDLHPIEHQDRQITISGWISSPRATRTTSRAVYTYANNRFVRDRVIQHALFQGYSQRLVKGQFPVAVIFINVPFDQVDVNVHPTKNEVRFARQHDVHEAVKQAVAQKLKEIDRPGWRPAQFPEHARTVSPARVSEAAVGKFGIRKGEDRSWKWKGGESSSTTAEEKAAAGEKGRMATSDVRLPSDDARQARSQEGLWPKKQFGDLRIIGQFHNTYLVCESGDGLVLIDQHAAHERILYERMNPDKSTAPIAVQQLLVAETIEMGFREADILEKMIPDLDAFGLRIEHFGGRTFIVKSVPSLLAGRALQPLINEIVDAVAAAGYAPGLQAALDGCRKIMACHGAVRAGRPLSDRQAQDLLNGLDACQNPSHCPHGRPTWIRWDLKTLEKNFKRIVS
jgi:DNA mismatch repair protein MutL